MTKVIVAFRDYAKASKKSVSTLQKTHYTFVTKADETHKYAVWMACTVFVCWND